MLRSEVIFHLCIFICIVDNALTALSSSLFSVICVCFVFLSGLAAGMAIGIVGDAGVRAVGQQERLFVGMILILIFAEALGLYGLIVALILSQQSFSCTAPVPAP